MKFHIAGNRVYELSWSNLVAPTSIDGVSSVLIFASNDIVILGIPFLRQYYSIHDIENNRIGLAKSVSSSSKLENNTVVNVTLTDATIISAPTKYVKSRAEPIKYRVILYPILLLALAIINTLYYYCLFFKPIHIAKE